VIGTVYASIKPSTATSRWLPVKWRHFRVTSGHLRSRDIIFCHVIASCELQPCRKWNVQYTQVNGPQPLPGDFQSNDVTFGSLPVILGQLRSFPVRWQPPPASYTLVRGEMYRIRDFSAFYSHSKWLLVKWRHFRVTSSHLRSCDVISCHMTASYCELQPCRKWNV